MWTRQPEKSPRRFYRHPLFDKYEIRKIEFTLQERDQHARCDRTLRIRVPQRQPRFASDVGAPNKRCIGQFRQFQIVPNLPGDFHRHLRTAAAQQQRRAVVPDPRKDIQLGQIRPRLAANRLQFEDGRNLLAASLPLRGLKQTIEQRARGISGI